MSSRMQSRATLLAALLVAGTTGITAAVPPPVEYPQALIEPLEYLQAALQPDYADPNFRSVATYACFEAVGAAREALEDLIFAMQFTFWRDGTGHYKGEPWAFSHHYYCELKRDVYLDKPRETTRALERSCTDLDTYRRVSMARTQAIDEAKRVVLAAGKWCTEMYRRRGEPARRDSRRPAAE